MQDSVQAWLTLWDKPSRVIGYLQRFSYNNGENLFYFSPVSFGSNSIVSCNHTARVFDTSLELWSLNSIQI